MIPHDYFAAFRRFSLVLIAMAALGGLAALGLSMAATPLYTATTKLYFSPSFGDSASDLNQGSTYTQNQMLSFAQLAESPTVLGPVIEKLGLRTTPDVLADSITVTTPQNTVILDAAVTNTDPALAARIANEFAKSITDTVTDIAPATKDKSSALSVAIIASATTPTEPSSPDIRRNVLVGILIGLILAILAIALRERLDTRVHTAEVLATVTSAPLLGTLARQRGLFRPLGRAASASQDAENCRRAVAQLIAQGHPDRSLGLLVTSSVAGEGTSRVAAGLASAFAERGRQVLLVDADIRHPAIAGITGLDATTGLTDLLSDPPLEGNAPIQRWEPVGLDVLVAGPPVPDPSELIASPAMADLVGELVTRYDVLVIDTAPVTAVADAVVVGSLMEGAVMVADSTRVLRSQLAGAMDSLRKSSVEAIGVILTQVPQGTGARRHGTAGRNPVRSAWRRAVSRLTGPGARPSASSADGGTVEAVAEEARA